MTTNNIAQSYFDKSNFKEGKGTLVTEVTACRVIETYRFNERKFDLEGFRIIDG